MVLSLALGGCFICMSSPLLIIPIICIIIVKGTFCWSLGSLSVQLSFWCSVLWVLAALTSLSSHPHLLNSGGPPDSSLIPCSLLCLEISSRQDTGRLSPLIFFFFKYLRDHCPLVTWSTVFCKLLFQIFCLCLGCFRWEDKPVPLPHPDCKQLSPLSL